jgi:hypothetical protein
LLDNRDRLRRRIGRQRVARRDVDERKTEVAKVNPKRSRQPLLSCCLTMLVSSPAWLFRLLAVQPRVFRHT